MLTKKPIKPLVIDNFKFIKMTQDENIKEVSKLIELSGSNYEIADGEPDIKGWDVETAQHEKVGKVDDMLFDTGTRLVKYIIVEVDNSMDLNNKKVLIPIALADIYSSGKNTDYSSNLNDDKNGNRESSLPKNTDAHNDSILNNDKDEYQSSGGIFDEDMNASQSSSLSDNNVVIVPVNIQILKNLPAYVKDNVTNENESVTQSMFNTTGNAATAPSYLNDHSKEVLNPTDHQNNSTQKLDVIEENLQVNKQTVTTGGTRLISRIVEKPVEKIIELKDEHVTVVRTPIDRPVSSTDFDAFKEEQVEMTEYSEVPVVKKEAHVVEEITVTKNVSEKEEIIKETLRKTEATIEEIKKPKSKKKNI